MNLQSLIHDIYQAHQLTRQGASRSVNSFLIQRNWIIGHYLFTYEQKGEDRATYGQQLLERLAQKLTQKGIKGMSARSLRQHRQFYLAYPQFWQTLSAKLPIEIAAPSAHMAGEVAVPPERLLLHLSYSHFVELIKQEDPLKRAFYELQCIENSWNLRELKRQMGSLLFERAGISEVKYATGGIENELFVSRYLLQLPTEEELRQLLQSDIQRLSP